ncbi:MAG: TIGR03557 family F420-dependent LLM class oxidoreductase [Kineosporiaceae bacterium]
MLNIGYTLMGEQTGPRELVASAAAAERAGFDLLVSSDHYFPWLAEQGHSPHAWTVLGAVSQVTDAIPFMTYVTCPSFRYHPVVVAQKAATLQILSGGRFTLGLGSGENLNEHVVGGGWPSADVRQERLLEALDILESLFDGDTLSYDGEHFTVDSAKLWDLPDVRVPIGVAVSGSQGVELFAERADALIAVEPKGDLVQEWDAARSGTPSRKVGQLPVSWDSDADAAVQRAHEQFRWFGGGWKVNAELPGPASFAAASQFVRPEDVSASIPCGDKVEAIVDAVRPFAEAGFTDLALVQIGGDQQDTFLRAAEQEILPALREAFA